MFSSFFLTGWVYKPQPKRRRIDEPDPWSAYTLSFRTSTQPFFPVTNSSTPTNLQVPISLTGQQIRHPTTAFPLYLPANLTRTVVPQPLVSQSSSTPSSQAPPSSQSESSEGNAGASNKVNLTPVTANVAKISPVVSQAASQIVSMASVPITTETAKPAVTNIMYSFPATSQVMGQFGTVSGHVMPCMDAQCQMGRIAVPHINSRSPFQVRGHQLLGSGSPQMAVVSNTCNTCNSSQTQLVDNQNTSSDRPNSGTPILSRPSAVTSASKYLCKCHIAVYLKRDLKPRQLGTEPFLCNKR